LLEKAVGGGHLTQRELKQRVALHRLVTDAGAISSGPPEDELGAELERMRRKVRPPA
jgi:hypothetical protein